MRNVVSDSALIGPAVNTAFDTGDINPHNMFALSIAKCPL